MDSTLGVLVGVTARVDDDAGFSSKHIEVVSTVRYEQAHLEVQHVVWAFPGVPGLRTMLRVKALPGFDAKANFRFGEEDFNACGGTLTRPGARMDYLPLDLTQPNQRRYFGYYNDPGNRLPQDRPMLEENVVTGYPVFQPETIKWASGVAIEYGAPGNSEGVIMVKESPKTVNHPSWNTGAFFTGPEGIVNTGWGLSAGEIPADRFRDTWASWCIVYSGGNDGLQMALKTFDAARYPVFPARDMFILSNTWGPANPCGNQFAKEDFVLKEIEAEGQLGIDVMQIDDGWQKNATTFLPHYTHGWKDIKAAADKAGMRMGLWVDIRKGTVPHMFQDLDELGFISWKADFDSLTNRDEYDARLARYREVMKHAWMKTQFTLCPEYNDPRYGWYFAREYGSTYFQNIQEGQLPHLTMVPFQVLRQHWLLSKYLPSNKLQVLLQNPKRVVRPDLSDAREHGHGYCFAMGLPFVPCFFQSAQYLDDAGKTELAELIKGFKTCREDIFTSTTFPIGDEPCNAAWTGFQMVSTRRDGGHLLLFRERHNTESKNSVKLKFLAGKTLTLTDILHDVAPRTVAVGADGSVEFEITQPADYRLYRYEVK